MSDPTDHRRPSPGETLREHGLAPKKSLGQNFLADPAILASIADAADLRPDDVVLEIGPGTGLLTRVLAERAGAVVAVELDRGLAAACRETFAAQPHVTVVEADALAGGVPAPALRDALAAARGAQPWKLVANLPYRAAALLLTGCFRLNPPPTVAVVTVQREMADRFRAGPGTEHYGALSVRFQLLADAEVVRHLPAGAFWPRPKVRSSVIRCRPLAQRPALPPRFEPVLRALFDHRRKQVPAALAAAGAATRAAARTALAAMGLPVEIRGESLDCSQICTLARLLDGPVDDR